MQQSVMQVQKIEEMSANKQEQAQHTAPNRECMAARQLPSLCVYPGMKPCNMSFMQVQEAQEMSADEREQAEHIARSV